MRSLDDIERLATRIDTHVKACRDLDEPNLRYGDDEIDLARFVLAALPVVRAAKAWRENLGPWSHTRCYGSIESRRAVFDAVDTMLSTPRFNPAEAIPVAQIDPIAACACDFCSGRKRWADNWCARCAEVMLPPPASWLNMDVCPKCDEEIRAEVAAMERTP